MDAFVSLDLGYIYYSNSNTFINSAVSFFCVDFVSTSTDLSRNNIVMIIKSMNPVITGMLIVYDARFQNINNNKLVESLLKDKIQEQLYNADTAPVHLLFLCLRALIVPVIFSCTPIPGALNIECITASEVETYIEWKGVEVQLCILLLSTKSCGRIQSK